MRVSEIISARRGLTVGLGSTLSVRREPKGPVGKFTIVGSEEADLSTAKISFQSPLGASLLGKKRGDIVIVVTPKGEVKYKIIAIK